MLGEDPYSAVRGPWIGKWLLLGYTFEGVRAVGRQVHVDGPMMGVTHAVIMARGLRNYSIVEDENKALQSIILGPKDRNAEPRSNSAGSTVAGGIVPLF